MILHSIRIPGRQGLQQLLVANGKIKAISPSDKIPDGAIIAMPGSIPPALPPDNIILPLSGALAFPGLVNSHDHLDFNLFPQLGNRFYADYAEWGKDIHQQNSNRIIPVMKIPGLLRTRWGLYKNLLNGFTTVVHHGTRLDIGNEELITVIQDCHSLHSLSGERFWKWKLNRLPAASGLTAIHISEGTSILAKKEAARLRRWNLLKRDIVGIHGISLQEKEAKALRALVWCPDSNYFLYDRTADISRLKDKLPILFGSDSTLSSRWNIRRQLQMARKKGQLSDTELMEALTSTPAEVWGLPSSGRLDTGEQADLVVVRAETSATDLDAFYKAGPQDILLVVHKGKIRLFDASLASPLLSRGLPDQPFSRISVYDSIKYVQGDLPGLIRDIRNFYPDVELPAGLTPIEN